MKAASSPCALYQSPLSKIRIVSSSLAGRPRKNLIKPTSSSTCTTISNWRPSQRLPSHLHLWTRGHCQRYEPALEDTARRCIQRRRAVNYVILARRGMHLADQIYITEFSWIVRPCTRQVGRRENDTRTGGIAECHVILLYSIHVPYGCCFLQPMPQPIFTCDSS